MKIFVTGGSGFLGARLIPSLVDEGHTVFALARTERSGERVRALGAEPVLGDLDGDSLSVPDVDAVVHAAALFRFAGPRAPYFRANVDGTQRLLEAAQRAGVETFVYISAAAVAMDDRGTPLRDVDESAPTYPDSFSGYIASKARGEAVVLAANSPQFRTLALRPPGIWGPGGPFETQLPEALDSGRFALIDRGEYKTSTIHVDNVVEAIRCALERGTGGHAYFIADRDTVSFREFTAALAASSGRSIDRVRSLPYRLAFIAGRLLEALVALRPGAGDPPLTRTMVRLIGREFTTNDGAARRDLGYIGTTTRAEGLAQLAQT
ncbi:NAD-dependent epimerase/dehydratase family protein [Tsukamurella ocularis]|uniref:NAD-dependent epimerase/dehydratase family protein n=1 Tax=Tsukamurella ocularis TaxID=1970234 RepID=UPI00216979BC|nr:NAD-dependent epimerase/dehydratase family protein [Tsukamurella ocularis]MCS3778616.1 nucleoside-diphosphate-sugar epimerase [Tsukamurella ocularis]MCS3789317.1 nucleoside-diphosphate-sugar epimerase [Tsukamurella ocularis]MCS3851299.1 nucleoside-diphosphate-sugar epimerase [Tsukamurella ocularis]